MITNADYYDFPDILVEFLNYMDVVKNTSKLTISVYAIDLRTFFRFMKIQHHLVPVTDDK